MGASEWNHFAGYRPDLRARVLADGDYWWAARDSPARDHPDRPRTLDELFADERVRESGTHSVLDMERVLEPGEEPRYGWLAAADEPWELGRNFRELGEPEYGTVAPVTGAEALACAGVAKLTRAHLDAVDELAVFRGFGRCAVLHDATGAPHEIYFWGRSGD